MSVLKIKNGSSWETVSAGGVGVPSGGSAGDILTKSSTTDYATEWATPRRVAPDYSQRVDIKSYFPTSPTSSSTNTYTFTEDALVYIAAYKSSASYTLFVYIDNAIVIRFAANVAPGIVATTFPVNSGSVMKIITDNASATWSIDDLCYWPY